MAFFNFLASQLLSRFLVQRKHNFNLYGKILSLTCFPPKQYATANLLPKDQKMEALPQMRGFGNVGIVVQGPKVDSEDFTIATLLMLKYIYPDITICFSTWKDELCDVERALLKNNGINFLENDSCPAENKGKGRKVGHLNNQLKSSLEGIKLLKSIGCEYVMKLRSDLRIYRADFIPFFLNQLSAFPSGAEKIKKRLLVVGFSNNLIYCPFHMSDFIWFGAIDDMSNLYSIPSRTEFMLDAIRDKDDDYFISHDKWFTELAYKSFNRENLHTPLNFSFKDFYLYSIYHEEAYIIISYLRKIGYDINETNALTQYWRFLKESIIVVDESDIDVYWTKYGYSMISNLWERKGQLSKSQWLDIMLNYKS